MKKTIGIFVSLITLIFIPMLTDKGKEFIYYHAKTYLWPALIYWREFLIIALFALVLFLLVKMCRSKPLLQMKFEQLWDKEKNLYCKTCNTPVDRDLDSLWCPKCKKEIELFDGRRKIDLHEARELLP